MNETSKASSAESTVLLGGTLIDGNGNAPLRDACVVIRENRIVEVGTTGEIKPPAGANIIELMGKFILPGLIDIHVHYNSWMGELFLVHGVTTVKDMGNDIEWISKISSEIDEGEVRGPRLVFVGNALDASPPVMEHHIGLDHHDVASRAVELLHSRGVSAIKVREKITPDLLETITKKAHQLRIPVTGHLKRTDAREAAFAGIDGLEHATGIVQAIAGRPRHPEPDENPVQTFISDFEAYSAVQTKKIEEMVDLLTTHKVALIPTLADLSRLVGEHGDDFATEDAEYSRNPLLTYVPEGLRKMWETSNFFKIKHSDGRAQAGFKQQQALLLRHYRAGGKVLAGTDTFISVPGLTLQRELAVFVEAGFTPSEAISMVTRDNAEFLGRGSDLGTITPGKIADIIVVRADPLKDIRNIRQLSLIMKDGKVVDPSFHADYSTPTPKPRLTRPLWLERQLQEV